MIIDAHATDTVPSHEVRQRALEALANAGEPMSEVTYGALRKRLAESLDLEKSHEALRLGVEAQANLIEAQAARIETLEAVLRGLDDMIVDLDAGHRELHDVSRFINGALEGWKR